MAIQNKEHYANNYARAAAYFLGTCAPMPKEKQRQEAYKMITGIYREIFEHPETLGYRLVEDVAFSPWEQQKGHEKEIKNIRGAIAKVEDLIKELFFLSEATRQEEREVFVPADLKVSGALKKALSVVNITLESDGNRLVLNGMENAFSGLKELVEISKEHIIPITDSPKEDKQYLYFSRCVFEPEEDWTAQAFDRLIQANGTLIAMCEELRKRGYQRIDCVDGKKISLDFVKQYGKKEEPLKIAWGERTHAGISLTYEELRLEPCFLWIRVPMFKTLLEHLDQMPTQVVEFIKNHTKTCDGCRYCVQTDKTSTRPLSAVTIDGVKKCPLYPGFTMNFRECNEELTGEIMQFLEVVDNILT